MMKIEIKGWPQLVMPKIDFVTKDNPPCFSTRGVIYSGAGERSRTLDLLITSQLLYQLSYTGDEVNYALMCLVRQLKRHIICYFKHKISEQANLLLTNQ
jgi:hypothetical protein